MGNKKNLSRGVRWIFVVFRLDWIGTEYFDETKLIFCIATLLSGSERKALIVSMGEEESEILAKSPDETCLGDKKYLIDLTATISYYMTIDYKDSCPSSSFFTLICENRTELLPNFSNLSYLGKKSIICFARNWSFINNCVTKSTLFENGKTDHAYVIDQLLPNQKSKILPENYYLAF